MAGAWASSYPVGQEAAPWGFWGNQPIVRPPYTVLPQQLQQPYPTDLVAKVHLLDIEEIRRVPVEPDGLPTLQAFIGQVLNVSDRDLVHLSYVDDENDMIRVTNGEEFKEAVAFHCSPPESSGRKPTRVIKLFARVVPASANKNDGCTSANSDSKTAAAATAATDAGDSVVKFALWRKGVQGVSSLLTTGSPSVSFTLADSECTAANFFAQVRALRCLPPDKNVWCTYEDEDGDCVRFHNDYSVRHAAQLARSRSPDKVVKVMLREDDLPNLDAAPNRKRWDQCEFDDVVLSLNKLKANGFSDMSVCVELLAHFDNDVDAVMAHLRKEKK